LWGESVSETNIQIVSKKNEKPQDPDIPQDEDEEYDQPPAVNRRDVRIRVMQTLYAGAIGERVGESDIDQLASTLLTPHLAGRKDLLEFAHLLLIRAWNARTECDVLIGRLATNWDVDRIAPIDKAVLRMGIAELLFFTEIPTRVTINEAIDIAKRYSTDKSGVFINGMLDAAVTLLRDEGKLNKSGRGLME
jgi:N utilization substance protein B